MGTSIWIVISGGEIVESHKVQRLVSDEPGIRTTNVEVTDASGRFWRILQFGLVVASDGTLGKLCLDKGLAEVFSKSITGVATEALAEQEKNDYEPSQGLAWEVYGLLYGIGFPHEVCPFSQNIVDIVKGGGAESMAHAMTIAERLLEGTVEAAMKHRNDTVDEQGYAEKMWWEGWEAFKRKKWREEG